MSFTKEEVTDLPTFVIKYFLPMGGLNSESRKLLHDELRSREKAGDA